MKDMGFGYRYILLWAIGLLVTSVAIGQCPTPILQPIQGLQVACPVKLVQLHGWTPNGDGNLLTQIWTGSDAHASSTTQGIGYQSVFDSLDAGGLPTHRKPNTNMRSWPMVGINYTASSSSWTNPAQYPWPVCLNNGCAGSGNIDLGAEQAQQDGWLMLPDYLTCIRFQFSSNTDKSAALYIGADSTSLMSLDSILAVNGASGSSGATVNWLIPMNAPRMNGGNGFRYVRVRIYHHNPQDLADSEVKWDIGEGFVTIPKANFQSVSSPNSIFPRPSGMREAVSAVCYKDANDSLFARGANQIAGAHIRMDPRFRQSAEVLETHVRSGQPCDTIANCFQPRVRLVTRFIPNGDGEYYRLRWTQNAVNSLSPGQQDYTEAFSGPQQGLPPHVLGAPDAFGAFTISPTLGLYYNNHAAFQETQDAWLIVPKQLKYIEFKLGSNSTSQATGLWLGPDLLNMKEVAVEVDGVQSGGTYQIPSNCDTISHGWKLLRVRLYIHHDGGPHDSRLKWNIGEGFKNITDKFVQRCSSSSDNNPPITVADIPTSREYGLRVQDGTIWRAAGDSSLTFQLPIKDSLDRYVKVEVRDCSSPVSTTDGPTCDYTAQSDPCNNPPIAVNDTLSVVQNRSHNINVLLNDYDPDTLDTITVTQIIGLISPGSGFVGAGGLYIHYQPLSGFLGQELVHYEIGDRGNPQLVDDAWIVIFVEKDNDLDSIPDGDDWDDDNDGIADIIEQAFARNGENTDNDTIPDYRDLDSDNDGIPDIVEFGLMDLDTNGRVPTDTNQIIVLDTNGNGLYDPAESMLPADSDGDLIPDYLDLDSDNDGIYDIVERGFPLYDSTGFFAPFADPAHLGWKGIARRMDRNDRDGDGILDRLDLDSDNDGLPNIVEAGYPNVNGDGRLSAVVDSIVDGADDFRTIVHKADQDHDNVPNYRDRDSDNDGIPDVLEAWGTHAGNVDYQGYFFLPIDSYPTGWLDTLLPAFMWDMDADMLPNYLDLDSDNDGLYDRVEQTGQWTVPIASILNPQDSTNWGWDQTHRISVTIDSDLDGIPDRVDLDSDNDGIADLVEAGGDDGVLPDGMIDGMNDSIRDGADDQGMQLQIRNSDGDSLANCLDLDSDNDGIVDIDEELGIGRSPMGYLIINPAVDSSGWSSAHRLTGKADSDGDAVPNRTDLDSDNDGIYDLSEAWPLNLVESMDSLAPFGRLDVLIYSITYDIPLAQDTVIDSDGDLIPDFQDIDSDNDGLCDLFEDDPTWPDNYHQRLSPGTSCDTSGVFLGLMRVVRDNHDYDPIPDFRDLDTDQDGITDIVEALGADSNGDGRVDGGVNSDGWLDIQASGISNEDLDGISPHLDLDSDNDGIPDIIEGYCTFPQVASKLMSITDQDGNGWDDTYSGKLVLHADNDGIPDFLDLDSDNDSIFDLWESGTHQIFIDENKNGVLDIVSSVTGWDSLGGTLKPINSDSDAVNLLLPDYRDENSDNDLIQDRNEIRFDYPIEFDCDKDSTPNWQDLTPCDLEFYEGFSPNGDGINDLFAPRGIDYHRNNSFTVFNRWGQVVYKETNWNGVWNGVSNSGTGNGSEAPVGIYYYIFQYGEGSPQDPKGYFYLRR